MGPNLQRDKPHIKNEIYVDNILSGGHSLEGALYKQQELKAVRTFAGYPLKMVTSNHISLLKNLRLEDHLSEEF